MERKVQNSSAKEGCPSFSWAQVSRLPSLPKVEVADGRAGSDSASAFLVVNCLWKNDCTESKRGGGVSGLNIGKCCPCNIFSPFPDNTNWQTWSLHDESWAEFIFSPVLQPLKPFTWQRRCQLLRRIQAVGLAVFALPFWSGVNRLSTVVHCTQTWAETGKLFFKKIQTDVEMWRNEFKFRNIWEIKIDRSACPWMEPMMQKERGTKLSAAVSSTKNYFSYQQFFPPTQAVYLSCTLNN